VRRILLLAALTLAIPSSTIAASPPTPGNLVFAAGGQGHAHLFTMQADGTVLNDLVPEALQIGRPAWSPDGTKVAYAQTDWSGIAGIYVLDVAAGTSRRLTSSTNEETPVWSPDGRRLAFIRNSNELYVIGQDGSNPYLVAEGARPWFGAPDWSVADEIAYSTDDEIRAVRPDGSGDRSLGPGWGASWSPDGGRVAFYVPGGPFGRSMLNVENSDGSGRRQISPNGAEFNIVGRPGWSPDGTKIAFAARAGDRGVEQLREVDVDGGGEQQLTHGQGVGYADPVWSPDGQKIAFQGSGVEVINADGTCELHLHEGRWPSWQPGPGGVPTKCANLEVSGGSSPPFMRKGQRFTYQVRVSNLGVMGATNVRIVGKLAGRARALSISRSAGPGSCDISGPQFECVIDRLPVDGTVLIRANLRALRAGALSASVEAAANEVDPNPNDNTALLSAHAYNCSLLGTQDDDSLRGTRRADVICSLGGSDTVRPMAGRDSVSAGAGNDSIDARDGYRDVIDCGSGFDRVLADSRDRVAANCERVERGRAR
jgi:hypothetical protein